MIKKYVFGENTYYQKKMVIGQSEKFYELLHEINLKSSHEQKEFIELVRLGDNQSEGKVNMLPMIISFLSLLGSRTTDFIVNILIPTGKRETEDIPTNEEFKKLLMTKNYEKMKADLEWTMPDESISEVVEDFFVCNPKLSAFQAKKIISGEKPLIINQETGLKSSSADSPREILPKEMKSSGDAHLMSASPI